MLIRKLQDERLPPDSETSYELVLSESELYLLKMLANVGETMLRKSMESLINVFGDDGYRFGYDALEGADRKAEDLCAALDGPDFDGPIDL